MHPPYPGLQWPPVSDGALLKGRGDVRSSHGRDVEEKWLLRREPDHQLPVPLLQRGHVRQGHPHAAGGRGFMIGGCGLVSALSSMEAAVGGEMTILNRNVFFY